MYKLKKSIAVVLALLTVFSMSMFSTAATATINPLTTGSPGFYTSDGTSATENLRIGKTTSLNIKNMGALQIDGNISGPKDIAVVVDNSVGTVTSPFKYAIVTQEDMKAEQSGLYIEGSIHSNANLELNGNAITVSGGSIEAAGAIKNNGATIKNSTFKPDSAVIPFPNVDTEDKAARKISVSVVSNSPVITDNTTVSVKEFNNGTYLHYKKGVEKQNPNGTYNKLDYYTTEGSPFTLNTDKTSVYFHDYGVIFSGLYLTGKKQYIASSGNIYIEGTDFIANDAFIYSENGNIDIGSNTANFSGVIYAPNGTVKIHSTTTTINGSIVANSVILANSNINIKFNGSGIVQDANQSAIDQKVKDAKDLIKQLLVKVQDVDNVRMGVLVCNSYAMPTTSSAIMGLYSTKAGSPGRVTLDSAINNLSASGNADFNLGDGLRRAYHLLYGTGSNITIPKYIIVLGYNAPNKYTLNNDGSYQTDNNDPKKLTSDDPTKTTTSGAIYANTILQTINKAKMNINDPSGGTIGLTDINAIYPIFINYTGKGDSDPAYTSLETIATNAGAKFYEYTAATGDDVLKNVENALLATVGEFTEVIYNFKLPKNAVLVDANKTIGNVTYGLSGDVVTITRRGVKLVYNGDIILGGIPYRNYIFNASVNVSVKFKRVPGDGITTGKTKTIPVDFKKDDIYGDRATVQYKFDYRDTSGIDKSSPGIDGSIQTGCTYNVTYKVDIG